RNGNTPGGLSSTEVTAIAAWAVAPGATANDPAAGAAVHPAGSDGAASAKSKVRSGQIASLGFVIARSNGTVVPLGAGGGIAGDRLATGARQTRPVITAAGAASVFIQTLSTMPWKPRPLASLPTKIGPTPGAMVPVIRPVATAAPLTNSTAWRPS